MAADPIQQIDNRTVIDAVFSRDPGIQKDAQDVTNEYLQRKAREDGIMRGVLAPQTVTPDELDPQVGTESPTKIYEVEPYQPPAVVVPFGTTSTALEILGVRGLVVFHKITTPRHRKDKYLLMTYRNDIRQVITDNDLREILEEEDVTSFSLIDEILGGAADTPLAAAGNVALWQNIAGGLTPDTWAAMMQIMPKATSRFRTSTVVMNQVLAERLTAWDGDELTQNMLEEVNDRGWIKTKFKGRNLLITIKRNVIADDEIYMFAAPNQLGRFFVLQDVTMYPKAEGSILEWWSEEVIGITLQPIGCAKVTLTGL
ncbi:MAG: hypothetical protein ABIG68_05915 [Acidobacteriota bacterium]